MEDEDTLFVHNAWLRLRHYARIEFKESSEAGDGDGTNDVRGYTEQCMSEDETGSDKEAHTARKVLEGLRHALAH